MTCTFLKALLSAIFTLQPAAQASASSRGQGVQSHLGSRKDVVRKDGSTSQILGGNSTALSVYLANTEITAERIVPRTWSRQGMTAQFCHLHPPLDRMELGVPHQHPSGTTPLS